MRSTPLVTVVIPVYNGALFLNDAIKSVLDQTYQHLEIIAIDDGSTDESPAILASYAPRVAVIRQPNAGVAAARNSGVQAAHGALIAFLDQDDWWLPEKVQRQVQGFAASCVGLMHTGVAYYDNESRSFVGRLNNLHPDALSGSCYERLLLGNGITNSSVMIRASLLSQIGAFDTTIRGNSVQDYDLWLRYAKHSNLGYIDDHLTIYRLHPNQGMWDTILSLTEEIALLERLVGDPAKLTSRSLRKRIAATLGELAVLLLDANDRHNARPHFLRAYRAYPSVRDGVLYFLSYCPHRVLNLIRQVHQSLRRRHPQQTVPVWARGYSTNRKAPGAHLHSRRHVLDTAPNESQHIMRRAQDHFE